jgi:translation initiation factor 3 subunit B
MREKDVPIEQVEIKEDVISFAWEPQGTKFSIISSSETNSKTNNIIFYDMNEKIVKHLKTLEKKPVNQFYWSPQGGFIVFVGLNGFLEFYNVNDLESMTIEEHLNSSSIEWDPTGRYVASVVSYWKQPIDNGFNIYSFQGKLLKHVLKDKFYELLWRPRPPTLLSKEKILDIKKNIQKRSKIYKAQEQEIKEKFKQERKIKRENLYKEFEQYIHEKEKQYLQEKEIRKQLRNGEESESEDNFQYIEESIEQIENIQEIIIED